MALTGTDPMPFGKHKGTPMGEVPQEYLQWIMEQDGADEDKPVQNYCREKLGGDAPKTKSSAICPECKKALKELLSKVL